MKVLIYGMNFAPEPTGVGKYTGELAAWLAGRGHEVQVIAAPPYYPAWRVEPPYGGWRYRTRLWQHVRVTRVPIWVPARPGSVKRLLHLASFALNSLPVLALRALERPDVIIAVAPAIFCAPAAWAAARLCGARAWLHIQDYEVDAAFELGMLRGGRLRRAVLRLESWLLRRFDRVSGISHRMLDLARRKNVEAGRLVLLPNWTDVGAMAAPASPDAYRRELGIPPEAVVALYSGNMGAKQGLEMLADVAWQLRGRAGLWFVFCGDGPQRRMLELRCAGLSNVRFLPLQPARRLGELLRTADVHLLPQRAGAADLVLPSKLGGMLASGRPVVCGAAAGTELAAIVAGRGTVVPPEDAPAMARALAELADAPLLRAALGAAAQEYARRHLDKEAVLARAEQDLHDCVARR
ncbi:WcaI family glycosyltransferase [Pigmentiphaga soli]|uniref:WcaI family glycosyltransferase n=1 Tax=Pigmentiphaga soli TaxID=1007095 RepID=A0ABP8GVI7_9BURK